MNKNINKTVNFKNNAEIFDYIGLSAITYFNIHSKNEIKEYIQKCLFFLSPQDIGRKNILDLIYDNHIEPLMKPSMIIENKNVHGQINFDVNIYNLTMNICMGFKYLEKNKSLATKDFNFQLEDILLNFKKKLPKNTVEFRALDIKKIINDFNNIQKEKNKEILKNKRHKFFNYSIINIPIIISIIFFLLIFLQVSHQIDDFSYITTKSAILLSYVLLIIIILLFHSYDKTNFFSSTFEKNKSILTNIDKFLPDGIKAVIWAGIIAFLGMKGYELNEHYNNLIIQYIKETGSFNISGTEQKIVFEPIKINNIDFIYKPLYVISYFFDSFKRLNDYFLLIVVAMNIMMYKYILIKNRKSLMLTIINTLIIILLIAVSKPLTPYAVTMKELNEKNIIANVSYPLLGRLMNLENTDITISNKDFKIDNEKLGLVSDYKKINITHSDELFCQLRNYNLAHSQNASIRLFDPLAGFSKTNESISVKITPRNGFKNKYDLIIINDVDSILIENTYLEYDKAIVRFKTLTGDTGLYLKCSNSMYSLYYNKVQVGKERYKTMFDMDDIRKALHKDENIQIYSYRGMNVNDENPFKCEQSDKECINTNNYYKTQIEEIKKIIKDNEIN